VIEPVDRPAAPYTPREAPGLHTAGTSLDILFRQFEDRYNSETSDVRSTTASMQEIIGVAESLLDKLDNRPLWKRIWQKITGHTYRLQQQNFRNQVKLQHTNMLLIAAIARQNRMVMEGLRLTLEKLSRVEDDARYIREAFLKYEERRERRRRRWAPVATPFTSAWRWMRSLFTKRPGGES
jgi:hypothetical protein